MEILTRAVARDRAMHIFYALAMLLVGFGFLSADLYAVIKDLPPRIIYRGFGIMGLGIAALLLWKAWTMRDPLRVPFLRMVLDTPGEIVWFYELRSNNIFATLPFLRLHLRDGDSMQLSVHPRKANEALELLERRAPHATRGFSKENEQAYVDLISSNKDAKA